MSVGLQQKHTKSVKGKDQEPPECGGRVKAWEGKEVIRVFDNDCTRNLIVPSTEPIDLPGIWPLSEYERLKKQATVITEKERKAMKEEADRKKIQLQEESNERREMLKRKQLEQRPLPGSKLNQVEDEASKKSLYLLQRAFELRQEQEDEVKKANSLILASKCLAIREAQLAEKRVIQRELDEEERRLDNMMEQRRQWAIQEEERKKQERMEKNKRFVNEMMQQIKENEIQRLVEEERKEEESRNLNRALIAMRKEDEEKERQKKEEQKRTREESNRANEQIARYKLIEREEQRIAELRVQEFMRKKAEREEQLQRELQQAKAAKEAEIARLQEMQKRAQDQAAAADELNALRIQEEVEKEWREKEKKKAQKKAEENAELKRARRKQIEDIRRAQALEIAREEQQFHEVAKVQRELYEKDQEKKRQKREAAVCHRKELLRQINEKELERIQKHKQKFEEGEALRLEQEVRGLHIKQILKKKVDTLRKNNVPEKFVKDIERELHV